MNSHIINPFKVDTQFTLQIHLIMDLTFKEAVVFDSIGIQSFLPSHPPHFYRFSAEVNFARFGWCLEVCCLYKKCPPNYRFNLIKNNPLAGWLAQLGERWEMPMMGWIKWTLYAQTPLGVAAPSILGGSFQPPPVHGLHEAIGLSCSGKSHKLCWERGDNYIFLCIWYN